MPATSGGEWTEIYQSLTLVITEYDQYAFKELLNLILTRKYDFLEYDGKCEPFMLVLSHLVTDFMVDNVPKISILELDTYVSVSKVLLGYFVYVVTKYRSSVNEVNQLIDISHVVTSIKSLCDVVNHRTERDRDTFVTFIQSSDYDLPPNQKSPEASRKNYMKTGNSDHYQSLVQEQLAKPLYEFSTDACLEGNAGIETELSKKIKRVFIERNESHLHSLHAGDCLVELCLSFPNLSPYFSKYDINLIERTFELPLDYNEARSVFNQLEGLNAEINILNIALSLNVIEPLNEYKVRQLTNMAGGNLYCAAHLITMIGIHEVLSFNSANLGFGCVKPVDEETISTVTNFVEKSIIIHERIQTILKSSTRVSAQVVQNHLMNCSYMLIRSLSNYMYSLAGCSSIKSKEEKGRSKKSVRESSIKHVWPKAQDAYSNLALALLSVALDSLSSLFQACAGESITDCEVEPASLSLMTSFNGLQRVACLYEMEPMNLMQFMIFLAPLLYRKACTLKQEPSKPEAPSAPVQQQSSPTTATVPPICDGESYCTSDSATYFEDDLVRCSEEEGTTDDDDDNEPILGHWLEETILAVNEEANVADTSDSSEALECKDGNVKSGRGSTLIPESGNIAGYMAAAGRVFAFLNDHVVLSEFAFIQQMLKDSFIDTYVVALAAVIRDVDREAATVVRFYSVDILKLYKSFSSNLMAFVHNMLIRNVLNETMQDFFLTCLGISPFSELSAPWQMTIHTRALSVLIQVLLKRDDKEVAYVNIWNRCLNSLRMPLSKKGSFDDVVFDDINLEHAQLLIFFFDSLSFMLKKKLLLSIMEILVTVAGNGGNIRETGQFLCLSRLLLFFDYMVKFLYEPSTFIAEQIRYNTIGPGLHGLERAVSSENGMQKVYENFKDLGSNYLTHLPMKDESNKHPFYDLTGYEYNNQQTPKLDGFALNFILNSGAEDGNCTYNKLISSFLCVFRMMDICGASFTVEIKHVKMCAAQYCVTIAWRLLSQLPPNAELLDKIMLTRSDAMEISPFMLYSATWGPRCGQKLYVNWLKDMLSKQGHPSDVRETLLRSVSEITSTPKYSSNLILRIIISIMTDTVGPDVLIEKQDMPNVFCIVLCDVLLCKFHASIEEAARNSDTSLSSILTLMEENTESGCGAILPTKTINDNIVQQLTIPLASFIKYLHVCIRSSTMYKIKSTSETEFAACDYVLFGSVMSIAGFQNSNEKCVSINPLPASVKRVIDKWNLITYPDFDTNIFTFTSSSETYALRMLSFHLSHMSDEETYNLNASLKHLLFTVFKFICNHISNLKDDNGLYDNLVDVLIPMLLDVSTVYLSAFIRIILRHVAEEETTASFQVKLRKSIFKHVFTIIMNYTNGSFLTNCGAEHPRILNNCITWFERQLGDHNGRTAIENLFREHNKPMYGLHSILLSITSPHTAIDKMYKLHILDAFNSLFAVAEKNSEDRVIRGLMKFIPQLGLLSKEEFDNFFFHILYAHHLPAGKVYDDFLAEINARRTGTKLEPSDESVVRVKEFISEVEKITIEAATNLFLENITNYVSKDGIEDKSGIAYMMLESLLTICGAYLLCLDGKGFNNLFKAMIKLAGISGARGQYILFNETITWTQEHKVFFHSDCLFEDICDPPKKQITLAEDLGYVLNYISDVLQAVCIASSTQIPSSVNWDADVIPSGFDVGSDWPEELFSRDDDDGESTGDDSDEDSLSSKLCSFTITQKEYMNQHWYHCHTCKMVDKVGVCSICARVCHKGHDVTYAKYGNFFCDCGAKSSSFCKALAKRNAPSGSNDQKSDGAASSNGKNIGSSDSNYLYRKQRTNSHNEMEKLLNTTLLVRWLPIDKYKILQLAKDIDSKKEDICSLLWSNPGVVESLLQLSLSLLPYVEIICSKMSPIGCHKRAADAIEKLHTAEKTFDITDKLMVPTLGSQEGAFENVRMNFSGDQGQTIRQLISAHLIHRVTMCCLSSPQGKRQHLVAVSHEKGKVTLLQLNSLLKQADSSKKKLTLTRLSSASIPFTILSVTGNPCNEDFLAVCGLKDCHVLTFSPTGSVADPLVLHPHLETGNFIIRAIWIPGSQTWLALVTADYVKIYDLSKDVLSPQYYFLIPTGKIRDVTFVCKERGNSVIIIMSSVGYIYAEEMDDDSLGAGPFYITNTLKVEHPGIKDVNGQICGGGVSVYYSHILKILFLSYAQGKSFLTFLPNVSVGITKIYEIYLNSSLKNCNNTNAKTNGGTIVVQPLCQWTEVVNHPGLVCAVTQSTNNPVILMIKPDNIMIQEIKVVPSKAKIMDMVVIRHPSSVMDYRTTLILLCEDGSLRIYMAVMDQTGYWLSPEVSPTSVTSSRPATKKKKVKSSVKQSGESFPVDFFEHSSVLTDIEFGGNDLLQIYNPAQLKNRLNTPGLYVVSTKHGSFSMQAINNDSNMLITGVRVLLGVSEPQRSPSFVEVFGRLISTSLARNRWYDIPLTREESIVSDQRLCIVFGQSADSDSVTIVDSVKVYGKSKDQFGWSEDVDEINNTATPAANASGAQTPASCDSEQALTNPQIHITALDRLFCGILNMLEYSFTLIQDRSASLTSSNQYRSSAISLSMCLMTLPTSFCIQLYSRALLAALYKTRQAYHNYKDTAALSSVYQCLVSFTDVTDARELDPEFFYHLVITVRSIAISRPSNIVKFVPQQEMPNTGEKKPSAAVTGTAIHLINLLMENMWRLHQARSPNSLLPSIYPDGLAHAETTVYALVEIIHAFIISDQSDATILMASKFYLDLLLSDDIVISFAAKVAIIGVLKPKLNQKMIAAPSPTHSSSSSKAAAISRDDNRQTTSEVVDDQEMLEAETYALVPVNGESGEPLNMEAILNVPAELHDILQADADDESMVELAIALSLQDQDGNVEIEHIPPDEFEMSGNIQAMASSADYHQLQIVSENQSPDADDNQNNNQETGHLSDTTASGPASDDEGSTVAIEGSTLRGSPTEQTIVQDTDTEPEKDTEMNYKLHRLHVLLLEKFISHIPSCKQSGGMKIIPFFQVVFVLSADLNVRNEYDKSLLNTLLKVIIEELGIAEGKQPYESFTEPLLDNHSAATKYHFILLRLINTLMYHVKTIQPQQDKSKLLAGVVADTVLGAGIIDWTLHIHKKLLTYWKNFYAEEHSTVAVALLKPHFLGPLPDASPFFLKQYIADHMLNLFELYPQLLTELMVRLPYQVQKHSLYRVHFDQTWFNLLCDYMMTQQPAFVKRQVRKLLLHISPDKDSYRQRKDIHAFESHMREVFQMTGLSYDHVCEYPGPVSLPYDQLLKIVEHLKACLDIALVRISNWRKFLISSEIFIPHMLLLCCCLDEDVAQIILQLMQYAICGRALMVSANGNMINNPLKPETSSSSSATLKKDANTAGGSSSTENKEPKMVTDETTSKKLVFKLHQLVDNQLFSRFLAMFLLDTNCSVLRYQTHFLTMAIFRFSDQTYQERTLELMWDLWSRLPAYGRKAYQFIDLVGYFTVKCTEFKLTGDRFNVHADSALNLLRSQNQTLARHPNSSLYSQISQFVEMDGFYLENEPCLVCNNPEISFTNIKLTAIKVDSKFTTNSQIIKLVTSHTISKITLRITDLKRTKMVKTMIIYYNNRNVQAIVELKNKPSLWHKAKKINLSSGQTDVKVEFSLPIIACNLLIEYVDFYENIQGSSETLTCPRCSASVPSNPGVCTNCGENVFQCHKCRAINYDEKDPFLCHVCGFCKYAKFEYTLIARPVCAIETIHTDDDRKKITNSINTLLEKADRLYKQFTCHKPLLESALMQINEHRVDASDDIVMTLNSTQNAQVNKSIQLLAQRYCTDCKSTFNDLSRVIQRILVCRKQLVAYDQSQAEKSKNNSSSKISGTDSVNDSGTSSRTNIAAVVTADTNSSDDKTNGNTVATSTTTAIGRCYGCASSVVENCVTILRAFSLNTEVRTHLRNQGLIYELVEHNLRRGSNQFQDEVRQLICTLVRDNFKATEELCALLLDRISTLLRSHVAASDLPSAIRPEIVLLTSLLESDDTCWEPKAKCVTKLFLISCKDSKSPMVLESVVLPCLKIMKMLIKPNPPKSKKYKDKTIENLATVRSSEYISVNVRKWIKNDSHHSFNAWRQRRQRKVPNVPKPKTKQEIRERYLSEKYFLRWKQIIFPGYFKPLQITDPTWLKPILFNNSSSRVRVVTSTLIHSLCDLPIRKKQILDHLTSFLGETRVCGQYSIDFLDLYQLLMQDEPWKQYLTLRGVLIYLSELISKEIQVLHELEETTLTSDLSQGMVLKKLVEIMDSFLDNDSIKRNYKGRLVGSVLNGYLSLRRLVIQRTRIIDETQEKLLELLEAITTGTEAETKSFMSVCVETVEKCNMTDIKTPVFIFERLCSIIFPEENDITEFYLSLEKDPQQEDFLQGRMVGNPYSTNEPGLGPLMRDVKNKICQDCELIALLEDDNGMELLINNKIISLDLPVKLVYKKIWLAEGASEREPMRVIYRMRGLLGDATEEFIETLDSKSNEAVDNEQVYKLANTMGDCGGLRVLLKRLDAIDDLCRYQELTQVCLKLLSLCVKVKTNQQLLISPEYNAVKILLDKLKLSLEIDHIFTENVLSIIETLLAKATSNETDFVNMIGGFNGSYYISAILSHASFLKYSMLGRLMHVVAALTYGNEENMKILMAYFLPIMSFICSDPERATEVDESKFDMFCVFTAAIDKNALGNTLKDYLKSLGFVDLALEYIVSRASILQSSYKRDSDEWIDYITRPALKYVIRYLTGLAYDHKPTQMMVSAECISIIHRLEQVSSDEHVGTLAENLLEALRTNPEVASRIEDVREQTKAEKKRLAMAMREKQLGALGMRTNEKGQVTAETTLLQQMEDLGEESGLVCVICREGYRFQPNKVLGIYTFTKRCVVEEFENKARKTYGYSTVTHFNVVHIECHLSAVRLVRTRDEWDSAALQNGNTKCNGLLPLWGPQVTESIFASALARHNTYLQECTGHRDISYVSSIHDLKLLLLRFAKEKSFHEDSGGGGPQSNMNLTPYLMHTALYVINTTKCNAREEKNLISYLECAIRERWIASAYETEGPHYWATMSLLLHSPVEWSKHKLTHLRRLLIAAHVRNLSPTGVTSSKFTEFQPKDYSVYKSALVFFGLIDVIYTFTFHKFKGINVDQWSATLAEYIRCNDEQLLKASEKLMSTYEDELLGATSFEEFCDLIELSEVSVESRSTFIADLLSELEDSQPTSSC